MYTLRSTPQVNLIIGSSEKKKKMGKDGENGGALHTELGMDSNTKASFDGHMQVDVVDCHTRAGCLATTPYFVQDALYYISNMLSQAIIEIDISRNQGFPRQSIAGVQSTCSLQITAS